MLSDPATLAEERETFRNAAFQLMEDVTKDGPEAARQWLFEHGYLVADDDSESKDA